VTDAAWLADEHRVADGHEPSLPAWACAVLFAAIGLTLRTTFGALPPVVDDIRRDLGLSALSVSLLTAIPVICIGALAPIVLWFAGRIGHERATACGLATLAIAEFLRLGGRVPAVLFVSALLTGTAMAIVSTLMPGLIGQHLRRQPGLATGIYMAAMASGLAVAAFLSVPLAEELGSWTRSIASWGLPTLLTCGCFVALIPRMVGSAGHVAKGEVVETHRLPWRSRTAVVVSVFFLIQTAVGFSAMAWLAPAYREWGWSAGSASRLYALFAVVQVVAVLLPPVLTDLTRDRRPLMAASLGCTAAGLGLVASRVDELAHLAVLLFGFGVGGGFSLGMVLLVDYTSTRADAARLSAMVFLVSYTLAPLGPLLIGVLHDVTGNFTLGYWLLFGVALLHLLAILPLRPGRNIATGRALRDTVG
jgi:CP family cyanate transporter-like MFS transporter